MLFIKDLEWANHLTERFRDKLEQFLPLWLDSTLVYYKVGKEQGADYFNMSNVITCPPCEFFNVDGIEYYKQKTGYGLMEVGFNGKDRLYHKCNWLECFCDFWPEFDTASSDKFIHSWHYWNPMTRYFNRKPEYRELADRCNAYFQEKTGDKDSGFSLSRTSMIYYNDRGRRYVESIYDL